MVYPNEIRLLKKEQAERYENSINTVTIKKNKHGRRVPEQYVELSYDESSDEEEIFE